MLYRDSQHGWAALGPQLYEGWPSLKRVGQSTFQLLRKSLQIQVGTIGDPRSYSLRGGCSGRVFFLCEPGDCSFGGKDSLCSGLMTCADASLCLQLPSSSSWGQPAVNSTSTQNSFSIAEIQKLGDARACRELREEVSPACNEWDCPRQNFEEVVCQGRLALTPSQCLPLVPTAGAAAQATAPAELAPSVGRGGQAKGPAGTAAGE